MVQGAKTKRERGQVAILFALIFTFMFILFAFVVDFAHLVNTKINLQLAADSAAYAGAAWQARTLNKIGMLNYRMRQDVKEMAMRLQVTHLRHNKGFPRGPEFENGGPSEPQVEPFICQQAHGYRAISGLRYANDTNLCRNASPSSGGLPPIVVPPVIAAFDPFAVAIAAQIRKIAEAANQECRAAADDNRRLAEHLRDVYIARSRFHADQVAAVGSWLNEVGSGPLGANETHPIRKVAYEAAQRNLSLAALDGFEMEVLGPSTGQYIALFNQQMNASIFFINFNVVGDGCVGRPSFLDFGDMIAGVQKEPGVITYFAVKLTARPRMLFMPQVWIDEGFPVIEAIASAKPFGSRIGPSANSDQLLPVANRPGNNNRQINFSMKPGDRLGIMNTKVMAFLDRLHPFNGAGRPDGNQNTGWPDANNNKPQNLRLPLAVIRAPTIFDAAFYPIFPDPGGNKDNDYFEPQYAERMFPDFLDQADPNNNPLPIAETRTPAYFPTGVGQGRSNGWIKIEAPPGGGGGPYAGYASEAPSSHSVVLASTASGISEDKAREFGFATREQVHSGWAPVGRPAPFSTQPRLGFSVKFISMDALKGTMIVRQNESGATGAILNQPNSDPNLVFIFH